MTEQKRIKVLIAKPGLDGHDRGARALALALKDAGMEVIYTGLRRTVEQIARAALEEDVDLIGISILSGAHLHLAEKLMERLRIDDLTDKPVIVGGNIPGNDMAILKSYGVAGVFPTGSSFEEITAFISNIVDGRVDSSGQIEGQPGAELVRDEPSELKEVILESGIRVKPAYGPGDIRDISHESDIGEPGEYPFTRGIHPLMYRKMPWTMRQYAGFGTPKETNERFKYLLSQGQTALNVAFDLPTQLGLDSDSPLAEGEVGRIGMAIDTLQDMEEAFDGIPIDRISTSLTINSVAAVIFAMYLAVAEKNGVPREKVTGTLQNDILKEYVGRGTWLFPAEPSIRLIGDIVEFCAKEVPRFNPFSVCGYHIRESGADPVQEMAYAFEIAITYIVHMLERGSQIDDFAPRISFNFDIFGNLWEQVAKFRAGRRLWAKIMKERFKAKKPRSMWMRMIAGGGGGGLTIREPENNIVRGAYYALISALSGTQTMALCSFDEAYTIPSKRAARISLRTMQILADEMGLRDTVDPLAGSYYLEWLTNEMEKKIAECMEKIEKTGGMVKAIESGCIQREVSRQAYIVEKKIQSGEILKIGVNKYVSEEEESEVEYHPFNAEIAEAQKARLHSIKSTRDNRRIMDALQKLKEAALHRIPIMPGVLEAVKCYATLGEITNVLREVYGDFQEPVNL